MPPSFYYHRIFCIGLLALGTTFTTAAALSPLQDHARQDKDDCLTAFRARGITPSGPVQTPYSGQCEAFDARGKRIILSLPTPP